MYLLEDWHSEIIIGLVGIVGVLVGAIVFGFKKWALRNSSRLRNELQKHQKRQDRFERTLTHRIQDVDDNEEGPTFAGPL